MPAISLLTKASFGRALKTLAARDADLGRVIAKFGRPPMWEREPGFATLVLLILEQQVSLASARATFERLADHVGEINPSRILALGEDGLRELRLSRQKARYVTLLAEQVDVGELDVPGLASCDDDDARAALVRITGIGTWTADIYLLMALHRPDVWPAKDLALAVAAHEVKGLDARPSADDLVTVGEAWRPWRAVAARILWHYYLNTKRRTAKEGPI